MTQRFWVGETVRVRVDFTDDAGAPLTPTGVEFRAKAPDGSPVVGQPVAIQSVVGGFYADFTLDQAGAWFLRASCSGPTTAVVEDRIEARASNVI